MMGWNPLIAATNPYIPTEWACNKSGLISFNSLLSQMTAGNILKICVMRGVDEGVSGIVKGGFIS
jgi:hypothetical protein